MEIWAQHGLVGLMICAIFSGIAWAGVRLLGKDGVLVNHDIAMLAVSKSLDGVTECLDRHATEAAEHSSACEATGKQIGMLHRAALATLAEIDDECKSRGMDVTARLQRVRQLLSDT